MYSAATRGLPTEQHQRGRDVVISCFDLTCIMVQPWADAGYTVHVVDVQHPAGRTTDGNITRWGMCVYDWEKTFFAANPGIEKRTAFASFFPPCTDLAVSGARWFKKKKRKNPAYRQEAMDLVYWSDSIGRRLGCPYFIENPVSIISSEWRPPDYYFHPYEFGGHGDEQDGYKKTTCLWVGGGFRVPERSPVRLNRKLRDHISRMVSHPNRRNERSKTPRGFACAVFDHMAAIIYHRYWNSKRCRRAPTLPPPPWCRTNDTDHENNKTKSEVQHTVCSI
jgi:hypothetical protein